MKNNLLKSICNFFMLMIIGILASIFLRINVNTILFFILTVICTDALKDESVIINIARNKNSLCLTLAGSIMFTILFIFLFYVCFLSKEDYGDIMKIISTLMLSECFAFTCYL